MNEEVMKSLVSLIDETIAEVDELKKSNRFAASEVKIEGPGSGIAGKEPNGSLGKEEDDKKKKEEEDKKKKEEAEKADMDKGEGQNREADPDGGKHKMDKGEMSAGASDGSSKGSAPGQNRQADPDGGKHKMDKKEDDKDEDKDDKKKKKDGDEDKDDGLEEKMKKSAEEANTLLKSYVNERLSPIEKKLESLMTLVKEIADSPVPSKGQTYRSFDPLKKSDDSAEGTLTKSGLVEKLFELKKSGTRVDSVDIASAELAKGADLVKIANKYNIK